MAFFVRVVGPAFPDADAQEAFARIESEIRQYSLHTRESFVLARYPFAIAEDHFVLLWSHGAAYISFLNRNGEVRGSAGRQWSVTTLEGRHPVESAFENPIADHLRARDLLLKHIEQHLHRSKLVKGTAPSSVASAEGKELPAAQPHAEEYDTTYADCTKTILLLIGKSTSLHYNTHDRDGVDKNFHPMTLEEALGRSFVHQPNLVRLIDTHTQCFTGAELEVLADSLELEAERNSNVRAALVGEEPLLRLRRRNRTRKRKIFAAIIAVAVVIGIIYWLSTGRSTGTAQQTKDTTQVTQPPAEKHSTIVIVLDSEQQLFVSREQYRTRAELDRALSHGEGYRLLPSTNQVITFDSAAFAKGVYGYFKVDNEWRRGKLLQTFKSIDTFNITNFLPPLE